MREPFPLRRLDPTSVGDDEEFPDGLGEDRDFVMTATHVSQTWTEWGRTRYVCLPLHLVSSVVFRFHAPLWRLALALPLLLAAAGLWLKVLTPTFSIRDEWTVAAIAATLVGLLALLAYFAGRKQVLVVNSASGRLVLERRGGDDGTLKAIADKIVDRQQALLRRGLDKGASPGL